MRFNIQIMKQFMKENNLTVKEFCKLCGVSYSIYKKILNHQLNMRSSNCIKVVKVLNTTFDDFLID